MKISTTIRLAVSTAAAAATITTTAGPAHADEFWFSVGDHPGPGSSLDVICLMTDQTVQCFPNQPTYPVPGEPPSCTPNFVAATLYRSGPATMGYVCRHSVGAPNVPKWTFGDSQRVGPFYCGAYGTTDVPDVFCMRDDSGGNSFQVARTWYHISDAA